MQAEIIKLACLPWVCSLLDKSLEEQYAALGCLSEMLDQSEEMVAEFVLSNKVRRAEHPVTHAGWHWRCEGGLGLCYNRAIALTPHAQHKLELQPRSFS